MIDRISRNKITEAIDRFLNDETDNFELDDELWEINSEDETVAYAVQALWFHYDDCAIHQAVLNKTEWDFIQRLKLLLMSDAEILETSESRWSWDHALACVAFMFFAIIALMAGWGWHLFIIAIPFGLISLGITRYRNRKPIEYFPEDLALYPFESFSQIRKLRRSLPDFSKQRYREEVGKRRIRSASNEGFISNYSVALQILFGPLVLLFQGMSSLDCERVTLIHANRGDENLGSLRERA